MFKPTDKKINVTDLERMLSERKIPVTTKRRQGIFQKKVLLEGMCTDYKYLMFISPYFVCGTIDSHEHYAKTPFFQAIKSYFTGMGAQESDEEAFRESFEERNPNFRMSTNEVDFAFIMPRKPESPKSAFAKGYVIGVAANFLAGLVLNAGDSGMYGIRSVDEKYTFQHRGVPVAIKKEDVRFGRDNYYFLADGKETLQGTLVSDDGKEITAFNKIYSIKDSPKAGK